MFQYGGVGSTLTGGDSAATAGLLQLFYSRRIGLEDGQEVPLLAGGKVTGRTGGFTVGAMNVETDTATIGQGPAAVDVPYQNYTVVRVKRDVLRESSLGVILLNRQGGLASDYNRSIGFDAGLNLSKALSVTGLFAKTFSPEPIGNGLAGALDVSWKNDRFNYGGTYLDVGKHFNAEMGFVPRVDIRNGSARAYWTPRPKWRGVRQLAVGGMVTYFEDHDGVPESRTQELEYTVSASDSSVFTVKLDRDFDLLPFDWITTSGVIPKGGYNWDTLELAYTSNQSLRVYGSGGYERGGYYSGDKQTLRAAVNFLLLDTLLVEPNYARNIITLPGYDTHHSNTLNLRVSYSFSPELFVKGFYQYNDDRHAASLNLLFWWIYCPGSDFYVVYDQGWDTDLRHQPKSYRSRGRSLTLKMTYWLSR